MPSVLFINRVYPPSQGATGDMLRGVAEGLAARGWDVTVLVTAEVGEPKKTTRRGVRVLRAGTVLSRKSTLLRAASYAFMLPWLLVRTLLLPRTDFVVTMTDPPMLAALGAAIRFFKRNKTIHWAQDLYPEVAEELGVLPRGAALSNLLRKISTESLRSCDAVVAIGRCMSSRLTARGIRYKNIAVIPNFAPSIVPLDRTNNPLRRQLGLEGTFVVAYSGNMGLAHDFETLLDAAERLRGQRIAFLMVGEGPRRPWIENEAARRGLQNMMFLPSQPADRLSQGLSAADAHIVTMRPNLCGLVVPSKFYGVLASGRPCLFVGPPDCEVARVIHENDVGLVFEPGESAKLAGAILDWANDPSAHAAACRRALVAGAGATADNASAEFDELLRSIAGKP